VTAVDLSLNDPIPRVVSWLTAHTEVTSALGGSGRVGALNAPPYPCIRVLDTAGGDDRDLRWLMAPEVQIEVYGDLDGSPGKEALRRILYTALGALTELPYQPYDPEYPVVTDVTVSRSGGWVPEPSGQPRYLAAVKIWLHP
jgi:hypothetical protein